MRRQHEDRRHADQQGIGVQQVEEGAPDVALRVEQHALHDVAEGHAQQQGDAQRRGEEDPVPGAAPARRRPLAAKLDRDGAQDQHQQHQHHRRVEAGEERGVDHGEGGKERAAAQHQPHLVAVPHRADAVQRDAPLIVVLGQERMQDPHAQIEAIHDQIAGDDDDKQHVPDDIEPHHVTSCTSARVRDGGKCL